MADSSANFDLVLTSYRDELNQSLADFFGSTIKNLELPELSKGSKRALELLQDFTTRPGKRVRGTLAAWAYDKASEQKMSPRGLQLGVAIELVQNYLLIVDDVMDRSGSRRGKPTIHKLLEKEPELGGDEHIASMLAINDGLLALHLAAWWLTRIDEKPERVTKASEVFNRNIAATVFGQVDDEYQHITRQVTQKDILRTYWLKSSSYTFINPLQLGVVLAGQDDKKLLVEIEEFGGAAGIAFQLRDDYLGVFGDPANTGKPNLDDIKEGKLTLMMHYALARAKKSEAAKLKKWLGNPKFNAANLAEAQQILRGCGAEEFALGRIKFYAESAKDKVKRSQFWPPDAKYFLNQLVDFVSERNK